MGQALHTAQFFAKSSVRSEGRKGGEKKFALLLLLLLLPPLTPAGLTFILPPKLQRWAGRQKKGEGRPIPSLADVTSIKGSRSEAENNLFVWRKLRRAKSSAQVWASIWTDDDEARDHIGF